jgi:thiol:disulfide interchange protein
MDEIFLVYIGTAFIGGVILNVMPCVLPVLTMKVFHVIEKSNASARENRLHGLAYTAGILATFLVFGVAVIAIRASGDSLGWGMQFQSPAFVAGMTALIFAFGLNALDVFEFTVSLDGQDSNEGYFGTFVNGVVASIMSTPCSAPFLGSAAAFALGAGTPAWQTLVMFSFIGFGLASPFVLISFVPAVGRLLPKPGAWMLTFKKLMGFTLLFAALWLFGVLQAQIERAASTNFLGFLLILAISLWSLNEFGGLMHSFRRRFGVRFAAAGIVFASAVLLIDFTPAARSTAVAACGDGAPLVLDDRINWAPFDAGRVACEGTRQRPVFMDFTADWCANCKANERLFIETERIRNVLQDSRILPMKADMTNDNDELDAWLAKLGRSGIPAYVIYMPDGSHDLLPEAITTEMLAERLEAAAKRFPASGHKAVPEAPSATKVGRGVEAGGHIVI